MIAPRAERRGLRAAKPVLVVGMAPSRAGHDIPGGEGGPTLGRLARYAGADEGELYRLFDFVNLLPEWPGEAPGGSAKWDSPPGHLWGAAGQRAELLRADLMERPRRRVIGLGGYVRDTLSHWWDLPKADWFDPARGPGEALVQWSPHPAGTNMWWNDPAHAAEGSAFWRAALAEAGQFPRAPSAVRLAVRSRWLVDTLGRLAGEWPEECVDWPWVDPAGRPQAYHRGASMPAAQIALELSGRPRPSPGHQALHSCDRGDDCVNPGHLRWGTELENRLDQVERGRGSIGKIGLADAREIVAAFDRLAMELAKKHGATTSAIKAIAMGKSWHESKWETGDEVAPTP